MSDKRECPVCGSVGERRLLHRQRFTGETVVGEGYEVMVCGECGAGFADGIPTQTALDRHYERSSKYEYSQDGGHESVHDLRRFELIVEQLLPFLPNRAAAILDVGCATGGLLACLARRGFNNLLGSDPSESCIRSVRALHGIAAKTATLAEIGNWTSQFDLILLVGVLEHLRDVQGALANLIKLLAPQGLLYCAQPDVEAFAECSNAPYQQFSTEHLNFFSRSSLSRLFHANGMETVRVWTWMVEWREGITDSVVSGLFRIAPATRALLYDDLTLPALTRYLETCETSDLRLRMLIESLVASQEPLVIWGIGTLARRLFSSTKLSKANIVALVDTNPHVQGETLLGRQVLAPETLKGRSERIFVISGAFQAEIVAAIRGRFHLSNELITLAP